MEKYLKTLLNVIKHFQTNASPSAKHNERFRLAIGLFPQGGCGPGDKLSTQSKRRGACTFLTKVHKDLGFDVFLLCTFAFAPTTLYDIGQLGSFNDESQKKIKELLQDVSGHFGTVVEEFKKKSEVVFVEDAVYHALHGQAPGRSKRKLTSTEEASERATAHRIRRLTPKDGESSDVGTTRPSIGPPVSNGLSNPSLQAAWHLLTAESPTQTDYVAVGRQIKYAKVYSDDREASTNAYWGYEDQIMFPVVQSFLTRREDYPDIRSGLKFDRTVSQMSPDGSRVTRVVTGEDKRPGAPKGEIKKAEDDVENKSLIESTGRRLEPLFGHYSRADKNAYIDIRTSFGQYEWHRLGSLVKNEAIRPLEEFGVQHYLVASPEWMVKVDKMQRRLEAQEHRRLQEALNVQEVDEQYEQEQFTQMEEGELGQEDCNPSIPYEPDNMDEGDPSHTEYFHQTGTNPEDFQGQELEMDDAYGAVAPEPQPEAGPSQKTPRSSRPEVQGSSRREKQVTLERRTFGGYKFLWKRKIVTTEKSEWDLQGEILYLKREWQGYYVWGYKP
ncbi:hypothetical protein CcaCcLH18_07887 [Colletotrichum camelliae]|nr:hypothetical protein CcaCcLH18_07887 [Colletotrichum camelliae]